MATLSKMILSFAIIKQLYRLTDFTTILGNLRNADSAKKESSGRGNI